jgi:hypothetical protein
MLAVILGSFGLVGGLLDGILDMVGLDVAKLQ